MSTGPAQETPSHSEDKPGIWPADTYPMFPVEEKNDDGPSESVSDPWSKLYHESWDQIHQQSTRWKDEIQALLTFTGLFSAIVGGFLAATYKDLSLDPGEANGLLLSQIALRLDASIGITNATTIPPLSLSPSFSPPLSLVLVHVFWFLSLTLALSTAIVGILCLQWIREYDRHSPHIQDSRRGFAILAMRIESFRRWHVPTIIAYLPVLLQVSLGLFFVGIINFLLPLGKFIAIPTITVISITFLFILYTTFAPLMEIVFRRNFKGSPANWYPCVYRSPQAWRVFVTYSTMTSFGGIALAVPLVLVKCVIQGVRTLLPPRWSKTSKSEALWDNVKQRWRIAMQLLAYEMSGMAGMEWFTASGIDPAINMWTGHDDETTDQLEGIHALRVLESDEVVPAVDRLLVNMMVPESDLISSSLFLRSWSNPPPELRATEHRLLLIATFRMYDMTPGLALREVELYIRLLAGIYAGPRWMETQPGADGLFTRKAYIPEELKACNVRGKLVKMKNADGCIEQLVLIWASFVKHLLQHNKPIEDGRYHRGDDIWYLLLVVLPTLSIFIRSAVEDNSAMPSLTEPILRSLKALEEVNIMARHRLHTYSSSVVRMAIAHYLAMCCGENALVAEVYKEPLRGTPPLWDAPFGGTARPLDARAERIVGDCMASLRALANTLRQKALPMDGQRPEDVEGGVFGEDHWSAVIPIPPPNAGSLSPDNTTRNQRSDPPLSKARVDSSPSSSSQPSSPPDATSSRPSVQDGETPMVDNASPPSAPEANLLTEPESSTSDPPLRTVLDWNSLTLPYPTLYPIALNPYDAVIHIPTAGSPTSGQGDEVLVVDNVSPSTPDANLSTKPESPIPDPLPTNDSNSLALPYPTPPLDPPNCRDAVIDIPPPGSTTHSRATPVSASGPPSGGNTYHTTGRGRTMVADPSVADVPPDLGASSAARLAPSED